MKVGKLKQIPLDLILDPELPMRSDVSAESVADLVASIKQIGIIEPLVVHPHDDKYQVIAGHRRLRAAEIAGQTTAPCLVVEVDEAEIEIVKLHENFARAEINAVDWAKHLTRLKQHYNLSTARLAEMLGMSEAWIQQHMKILEYDDYMIEALETGKLGFSAARELGAIKDPQTRQAYVQHAITGGVTPALAARWKIQANTPRLPDTPNNPTTDTAPVEIPPPSPYEVCAVCNENIPLGEEIHITIHKSCGPR